MDKQTNEFDQAVNIDTIGEIVHNISSGEKLKILICPACERKYIRTPKVEVKYVDCLCKTRIQLKKRWYD